jgi:hypothetical protein
MSTLALGEERGWRRCVACRALIERKEGCTEITYPPSLAPFSVEHSNSSVGADAASSFATNVARGATQGVLDVRALGGSEDFEPPVDYP